MFEVTGRQHSGEGKAVTFIQFEPDILHMSLELVEIPYPNTCERMEGVSSVNITLFLTGCSAQSTSGWFPQPHTLRASVYVVLGGF